LQQEENGWIRFGLIPLTKGTHRLEVEQETPNFYLGPSQVTIKASSEGGCYDFNTIQRKKGDVVRVTFSYKEISGEEKYFVKLFKATEKVHPLDVNGFSLENGSVSHVYQQDFGIASNDTFRVGICYLPSASTTVNATLALENITINALTSPDMLLYRKNQTNQPIFDTTAYTKENQVTYQAMVNNSAGTSYILSLNEAYNPNWQINTGDKHISLNGYKNGWIVTSNPSEIVLSYQSQRFIRMGFMITGVSIVVLISILFYKKTRRKQ
jgi:hypothetical protein